MENYTPKEIEQLRQEEYNKLKKLYETNLEAWNNKDKSFKYHYNFMTTYVIESDDIDTYDDIIDCWVDLAKTMNKREFFEKNNFYITKDQWLERDIDYEERYVNSITFINEYTILRTSNVESMLKALAKNNFKNTLAELMFDKEKHRMRRQPDPQMLDLFMNGIMGWKQLVTMTHSNNMK